MTEEATSPVAEEEIVSPEAPEVVTEADAPGEEIQTDEDGNPIEGQAEDDGEEIEHEGAKYKLPKALAKEFREGTLRQQDYTKKTQETAELRRAAEAAQAAAERDVELVSTLREDYGRQHALQAQVEYYGKVDWQTYSQQDPTGAQQAWMVYQQAKDQLRDTSDAVKTKEADLRASRERETANAQATTMQTLRKDIPDFSPAKAQELAEFARSEFGVRPEELGKADARTWKVLHRAMSAEKKLAALETKETVKQRVAAVQTVKPAATVRGTAPTTGLADNLSPAEWQRRFLAQRAKRA